jgi:hypothetical protein
MRWIRFSLGAVLVVGAAAMTTHFFSGQEIRQLNEKIDVLKQEKQEMIEYARRLKGARRVAQIDVLDQRVAADGRMATALRWQEIGADGMLAPPLAAEVVGERVYVEAAVIKFDYDAVGSGDPAKKESLAMFHRLFGDRQRPVDGFDLRRREPPVDTSKAAQESSAALQRRLWQRFQELVDDPTLAARYDVRVAQSEAPSVKVRPGQIWEVSLDAAGGLNLRKLAERKQGEATTRSPSSNAEPHVSSRDGESY